MGMPYGLQAMLKEGHQHMKGMDEAVYRNIDACKQLSQITKTSMGPNGKYWTAQAVLLYPVCYCGLQNPLLNAQEFGLEVGPQPQNACHGQVAACSSSSTSCLTDFMLLQDSWSRGV